MAALTLPEQDFSTGDLWVFGYGSLMWRPGFDFLEQVPARLVGEHRALCVYSFVHRGTPEKPGLVLGLDRGGACRGVAFRVADKKRAETVAYFAGRLSLTEQLRFVRQGHGQSGANRDYVIATVKAIEAEGFRDAQLHQLAQMLHDDGHALHAPAPETASEA
jgi:cation transport protein ChaC